MSQQTEREAALLDAAYGIIAAKVDSRFDGVQGGPRPLACFTAVKGPIAGASFYTDLETDPCLEPVQKEYARVVATFYVGAPLK